MKAENVLPNRAELERRGRLLAFFSVARNSLEAIILRSKTCCDRACH